MTKKHRLISSILALAVVFVMLFSAGFVIAEAHHDCTGEDCPICGQIIVCENALRFIGVIFIAVIWTIIITLFIFSMSALAAKPARFASLVTLKVKLSN